MSKSPSSPAASSQDFIREQVQADLASKRYDGRVVTRFPPEPNGYLHIGHAKAICIDFGIAKEYQGRCHLRMDDTNPAKEDTEFVQSIQDDIHWLGFDWGEHLYFASDYFERLYSYAQDLIRKGLAYVCSLDDEAIRAYRGSLTEPGKNSPYRERSVEENLDLFSQMREGKFKDGEHVLRAKIDMSAANMKLRDPLLYRIRHVHHHRTGDKWCIYPLYDYAHCVSDAIEGVTHSLCSLEFENNRDVYDWVLEKLEFPAPPKQYEFARLNLTGTLMSKRKLLTLIEEGAVSGWDDPRMPTLAGMRRRGYLPEAIREFCARVGIAKAHSVVDMSLLEFCLRNALSEQSPRVMCVQEPLTVQITNFQEHFGPQVDAQGVHWVDAPLWPIDVPKEETRKLAVTAQILIDRQDFSENPPKGFIRLKPDGVVRLRHAGVVRCEAVEHDAQGQVSALKVRLLSEAEQSEVKIKGTIQWVSKTHSLPATLRLFDRLVIPDESGEQEVLNPDSLQVIKDARVEQSLQDLGAGQHLQFERMGYFYSDPQDHSSRQLVFNRTVTLKDTWSKKQPKKPAPAQAKPAKSSAAMSSQRAKAKPPKLSKSEQRKKALEASPAAQAMADELMQAHGLEQEDAEILATRENFGELLLDAAKHGASAKSAAKWIVNDLVRDSKAPSEDAKALGGARLAALIAMVESDQITGQIAKVVFAHLLAGPDSPDKIVKDHNLAPIRDPQALKELLGQIMAAHPDKVQAYRGGNQKLSGFFLGQCVKQSQGRADAAKLREILDATLQGQ